MFFIVPSLYAWSWFEYHAQDCKCKILVELLNHLYSMSAILLTKQRCLISVCLDVYTFKAYAVETLWISDMICRCRRASRVAYVFVNKNVTQLWTALCLLLMLCILSFWRPTGTCVRPKKVRKEDWLYSQMRVQAFPCVSLSATEFNACFLTIPFCLLF